jgi:hypothetical protein
VIYIKIQNNAVTGFKGGGGTNYQSKGKRGMRFVK